MYPSHILTIFQIFQNLWSRAIGGSPLNSSNLSLCPFIWNSHLFYFCKISSFFDGNTWSENFPKYKTFLHLLKSVNNKHTLFELMSRRNVHQHPPRERLHSGRETWLSAMEKTSALSKCSHNPKIQKELAKLKTWKGGLGNRERPGGPKTW